MSTAVVSGSAMPGLQSTSQNSATSNNINHLSLNLNSNNPFRNRAGSPALKSPRSPDTIGSGSSGAQARMSKNPFLDDSEASGSAPKPAVNIPSDIFNDLSLLDRPADKSKSRGPPPPPYAAQPGRAPPNGSSSRGPVRPPGSPKKLDERPRRPRGMSEVSQADKDRQDRRERERERGDRPPRTESEERRRAARRKEREERHKKDKERGVKPGSKSRRPQGLDIIDKLDVTGIYGQGLFHHDGPFDACNPHRNSKRDRKAPMQAFPANSANMQLGGSGPLNNNLDLDRFHGRGEEAFGAFNNARRATEAQVIDPTSRVEQIHGDETHGLGTSTFLEGAPASRREIQRQDDDEAKDMMNGGGLSRKKSLAQKFRGMSSGRANRPTDLRTPEARFTGEVFDASPPQMPNKSVSAGGQARAVGTKDTEFNPFDNDYENAYEKKGAQIRVAEQEAGRSRAPSSPKAPSRGLVRTVTADSANDMIRRPSSGADGESSKTGFLNRMKSLKGGKRARPERRES